MATAVEKIPPGVRRGTGRYGGWFTALLAVAWLISVTPLVASNIVGLPLGAIIGTAALPFIVLIFAANRQMKTLRTDLTSEVDALSAFIRSSEDLLRTIRAAPNARISSDDVVGLVPRATREPTHHAKALIEEIAGAKLYLLSTPAEMVIQPHRRHLEARLLEATRYGMLSTRLGILGTFVGLVFALSSLANLFASGAVAVSTSEAIKATPATIELTGPITLTLSHLSFAFVTSIYGLVFSVLISADGSSARALLDRFLRRFDESISFGREFVQRLALSDPAIHASLSEVGNALRAVEQRLFDHGDTVASSLKDHGQLLNDQLGLFSDAAKQIAEVQKEWRSAFDGLIDASSQFESRTTKSIDQLREGFGDAANKLIEGANKLEKGERRLAEEAEAVTKSVATANDAWTSRFQQLFEQFQEDRAAHGELTSILERSTVNLSSELSKTLNSVSALSNDLKANAATISDASEALRQHVNSRLVPSRGGGTVYRAIILLLVLFIALCFAVFCEIEIFGDPLLLKHMFDRWTQAKTQNLGVLL